MQEAVEQKADLKAPKGSLTRKGMITMAILVVYFTLVSLVIAYERRALINSVKLLDEIHQQEERQVGLNILVARAILTVNENYFTPNVDVSSKILILEIESVLTGLTQLQQQYASIADDTNLLRRSLAQLVDTPNRAVIADIRGVFHRLVIDLDTITTDIRARKQWLLDDYRRSHNRLTVEWLASGILGLGLLAGLMMFFFRRMTDDIKLVQNRATEIIRGYRGDPLPSVRDDEIGELMIAVNHMQDELSARENQIELGRQQEFHKEKMAAVGSLAAAVAHEINNPLSAIVGIAQTMSAEAEQRKCEALGASCLPGLILEQAKRVMQITRQIGEFSVPQSQFPELVDINGLVRSTCNFVSFDRRFRRLNLSQNLDPALPAAYVVSDHIVQVLMNLLINAADALEGCADRHPSISVTTESDKHQITIRVMDNGCGIPAQNIEKVFKMHFTTKPSGRGAGLGLALCRSLICDAGGDISIESQENAGTTVMLTLPIPNFNNADDNASGEDEKCIS